MRTPPSVLGLVVAALFYGYQAVSALLSLWLVLFAQPMSPDRWLISVLTLLGPLPYALAAFFVFLLWRGAVGLPRIAVRALVASGAGAVLAAAIDAVGMVQVSGAWFTAVPRRVNVPGDVFARMPDGLVTGFLNNLPVLLAAAVLAVWLLGRARTTEFDRQDAIE